MAAFAESWRRSWGFLLACVASPEGHIDAWLQADARGSNGGVREELARD